MISDQTLDATGMAARCRHVLCLLPALLLLTLPLGAFADNAGAMNTPLTLYIVRHGQTDWNREGRIQGNTDNPLNEFVSALLGGMKTLNCCYWLRSMENEPVKDKGLDRSLRFHQWLVLPEYQHEVRSWFLHIGELLADQTFDVNAIMELLQLACEEYLSFVEVHFAATHRLDRGQPDNWQVTAAFLQSKGVSVLAEFDSILQLVENFHIKHCASVVLGENGRL